MTDQSEKFRNEFTAIIELQVFVKQVYDKDKKAVSRDRIVHFLHDKVPSTKVDYILELAEQAGVIDKIN